MPPPECNTYDDQCPAGEKCNAFASFSDSWDSLACFALDPAPDLEGEPCTVTGSGTSGTDSCEQGTICWNVDADTNVGRCVAYCEGNPDAATCDNGAPCAIANDGVLNLCLPTCDPLLIDCAANEICVPVEDVFICAPDASGGLGTPGAICEFLDVCNPGLFCTEASFVPGCLGAGCCSPYCDLLDPTSDAFCDGAIDGTACVDFYPMGTAPPGFDDVGFCAEP